jgi:hypothetical protein
LIRFAISRSSKHTWFWWICSPSKHNLTKY